MKTYLYIILALCSFVFTNNIVAQWTTIGTHTGVGNDNIEIDFDEINNRLLVASFDAFEIRLKSYSSGIWTNHNSLPAQFDNFMLKADPISGDPWVAVNQNDTLYAYKYDGANWIQQGPKVSTKALGEVDLEFNPTNNHPNICVEITDTTPGFDEVILLFDFNGISWNPIGGSVSNTIYGSYLDLEFDPSNNEPVVVYNKSLSVGNRTVEVRRFSSNVWTIIGSPDVGNNPTYNDISFDFQNNLILNFRNSTILKWNGSTWVQGSNASTTFNNVSVELDPITNNLWFVPDSDWVRELNGIVLYYVGSTIPLLPAWFPRLTFDGVNGNCFVACRDGNNDVLVKEFVRTAIGIEDNRGDKELIVSPNPSMNLIKLSKMYANYSIFSMDGKLVLKGDNVESIDISNLDNAAYLIQVTDFDSRAAIQKIIKQ